MPLRFCQKEARFVSDEVATCATPHLTGDVFFSFVEDNVTIPFADGEDMLFTLRGRSHAMRLAPHRAMKALRRN